MQAHVQHNRKDIFSFYAHQNDKNDRVGQRDTAASEIIAPPLIAADLLVSLILAFGNIHSRRTTRSLEQKELTSRS